MSQRAASCFVRAPANLHSARFRRVSFVGLYAGWLAGLVTTHVLIPHTQGPAGDHPRIVVKPADFNERVSVFSL